MSQPNKICHTLKESLVEGVSVQFVVELHTPITESDVALLEEYGHVDYVSELTNQVTMTAYGEYVAEISGLKQVKKIYYMDEKHLCDWCTSTENCIQLLIDDIKSYIHDTIGFTGEGVRIAVLDSGINVDDDTLYDNVVSEQVFAGRSINDKTGHGSSIASIISGLAPDAEIFTAKIFDKPGVSSPYWTELAGLEWAVKQGVDIINCSFGAQHPYAPERNLLRKIVKDHGVIVVAAAGNDQVDGKATIDYPAGYKEVVAVGSVSIFTDPYNITTYSSQGPAYDGTVKPDIVLPGGSYNGHIECVLGGGSCMIGSSQATAVMTGILAKLQEAKNRYPSLRDPLKAIYKTAWRPDGNGKTNQYGHGIADVEAALAYMER